MFPPNARLGDTIVMVVGTNAFPVFPLEDQYDLSADNVRIHLDALDGDTAIVIPRAVVDVPASLSGRFVQTSGNQGATITLAVFDLPSSPWGTFSGTGPVQVVARIDGVPSAVYRNSIYVEGAGGTATIFGTYNAIENFGPRPSLRVRPAWEVGVAEGFDPAWSDDPSVGIGSIEFVLTYDPAKVTSPSAFAAGDAANGLAIAGPGTDVGALRSSRIIIADPKGFRFAGGAACEDAQAQSGCVSGQGPFVEIAFTKDSTGSTPGDQVFSVADFSISDLRVYDENGNPLPNAASHPLDASQYFHLNVVNSLAD